MSNKYLLNITLSNRKEIRVDTEYYWGLEDKLNDTRVPFIRIDNYILKKDEIVSVKMEELKEDSKEVEF